MARANSSLWPAAREAAAMVEDGMVVGLGTGRAAEMFVRALTERVGSGLRLSGLRGVPTSERTAALARELGIRLASLEEVERVDLDVDGADEVSPALDLIKGHGGALVRERLVAAYSSRFVVLVGEEKLVPKLGTRRALPVEVVPFGIPVARRGLEGLGARVSLRLDTANGVPFRTDNGNAILDASWNGIDSPAELQTAVDLLPGVVDCGLFVGMADLVLVQRSSGVERLERRQSSL